MRIVDWIFPKMCSGCKKEGSYICADCQKKLVVPERICPMCCKASIDGWTHPRCRKVNGMDKLIVELPYRGVVQDCLKKVKYKSSWDIVEFLCRLCNFGNLGDCVVISVPMWREKERERGFNQAELVAQLLARNYKVPSFVMLERARETRPMFGLTKKERKENIEGAFEISKKYLAKCQWQSRVILVDDVWTTGATMRECAKVLKMAGVGEVWGIALAR